MSDGQVQATVLFGNAFHGTKERLFAAQAISGSGRYRLVEFLNPTTSFSNLQISDTDRLNGVLERCRLTLNASQYRFWDGKWSEWHTGTGEHAVAIGLANIMSSGLMGEWVTTLENKNGVWSQSDMTGIRDLSQDPTVVGSLVRDAGE